MNILALGKQAANLPDFINNRIAATNIVTVSLVLLIALPFFLISCYYAPMLAFLPGAGILTCLAVLVGNHFGYVRYTRFFISALPIWQVNLYNAYITEPAAPPAANLYLVAIAFFVVPFVLIDRREKWFLGFTVGFCSLAILLFPWLCGWFVLSQEELLQIASYRDVLTHGWLAHLTAFLAIGAAASSMVGINEINRRSEENIQASKAEVIAYTEQLEAEKEQHERKTKELGDARVIEERRQWIAEGISRTYHILRVADERASVFDQLITHVVKYLQANQAGLFLVDRTDEEAPVINLVACYAYERKKYRQQSIAIGEGLVGQAFLEEQPIYLTEVPAYYVKITSGLGEATPGCLLIVPLMSNGIVEGVLEIASFHQMADHEQEWVQQLGEVVSTYVRSERMIRQTRILLRQAQEQSEELQATEEEMRQNQEELQATQEEIVRQHAEMQEAFSEEKQQLLEKIERLEAAPHGAN